MLGHGKTGSGKRLAFGIPMVARLAIGHRGAKRGAMPWGRVLVPTRELATQIAATPQPIAEIVDLRVTTIFGGVAAAPGKGHS